jgi:hypothetical protein
VELSIHSPRPPALGDLRRPNHHRIIGFDFLTQAETDALPPAGFSSQD